MRSLSTPPGMSTPELAETIGHRIRFRISHRTNDPVQRPKPFHGVVRLIVQPPAPLDQFLHAVT